MRTYSRNSSAPFGSGRRLFAVRYVYRTAGSHTNTHGPVPELYRTQTCFKEGKSMNPIKRVPRSKVKDTEVLVLLEMYREQFPMVDRCDVKALVLGSIGIRSTAWLYRLRAMMNLTLGTVQSKVHKTAAVFEGLFRVHIHVLRSAYSSFGRWDMCDIIPLSSIQEELFDTRSSGPNHLSFRSFELPGKAMVSVAGAIDGFLFFDPSLAPLRSHQKPSFPNGVQNEVPVDACDILTSRNRTN